MLLEGSCHCRAVTFRVRAGEPVPFNRCYCTVCRKTAGAGGYAVNLGADHATLKVTGAEHLGVYRARIDRGDSGVEQSQAERNFCRLCGSALWLWDPRWPDQVHPHAGAIDTPLPVPPSHWHMMLASAPAWVQPVVLAGDRVFDAYPDETLADWHTRQRVSE
jgi:hypothetical protein